jgi:hypothetical protein
VLQNFILNTVSDWFNDKELVLSSCGTVALDGLFIHLFLWSSKKNK